MLNERPAELLSAAGRLAASGILSASGHGNLSVRLDDDQILLAAGVPLPTLTGRHLAVIDLADPTPGAPVRGAADKGGGAAQRAAEGVDSGPPGSAAERGVGEMVVTRLKGKLGSIANVTESPGLDPSALEIVPMHADVYRAAPHVGAIVHTHSPNATAFAVARRPLPSRYEALLRFGQAVDVPVVPWAPRGSPKSVAGILAALTSYPDTWAVLLANHGLLAFGPDLPTAVDLTVALEEAADAEWRAAALGGSKPFPAAGLRSVRRSMARPTP